MSDPTPAEAYTAIADTVDDVLVERNDLVRHLTVALLTRGHVLLEGVPGVAKTTAANLFARALDLEYSRVQMTPDVLPTDITGTHVYRESTGEFDLQRGPVFANLVVADEINRATPKTQSALLEAMQERTVTIEDETLSLPEPFMVIATQNPIEMEGTFELPEAQRDRFQLKLTLDLPGRDAERRIIDRFDTDPSLDASAITPVLDAADVARLRTQVAERYIADPVKEYILDIVAATREDPNVKYGASPRASLALLHTTKALAAIEGRSYVIPDDVKALAEPVLVHRIVLNTEAELSDRTSAEVVSDILERVTPPGSDVTYAHETERDASTNH